MAERTFTLTQQEYEALIALARDGTKNEAGVVDANKARALNEFLQFIEKNNGVTRDSLWVQWQELDEPLPPTANFPYTWPPDKRFYIELVTRKIAKVDVQEVIAARAKNAHNVLVTPDPGARVGWTPVDDYFLS